MTSFSRPAADLHGRPFETAPGVWRGTHEWRIDYGGAFDQWFCPHCSADWFEFDEPEPMTPCAPKADVHA